MSDLLADVLRIAGEIPLLGWFAIGFVIGCWAGSGSMPAPQRALVDEVMSEPLDIEGHDTKVAEIVGWASTDLRGADLRRADLRCWARSGSEPLDIEGHDAKVAEIVGWASDQR